MVLRAALGAAFPKRHRHHTIKCLPGVINQDRGYAIELGQATENWETRAVEMDTELLSP